MDATETVNFLLIEVLPAVTAVGGAVLLVHVGIRAFHFVRAALDGGSADAEGWGTEWDPWADGDIVEGDPADNPLTSILDDERDGMTSGGQPDEERAFNEMGYVEEEPFDRDEYERDKARGLYD